MRVTNSMYYENLYGKSHNSLNSKLFDVNKQIASGIKMQYASEDVAAFTETMRLDNEITTLVQITKSTSSGLKVSDQTDTTLNEFTSSINRIKTLLINATNDTHSDSSRDAIAGELRGVEEHLKNLANTSINGQYLFSGSAIGVKPISDDGIYNGNADDRHSFTGSKSKQKFNLSGADLFLGEEGTVRREITSNVTQNNLNLKYDFETGVDNGTNPAPITVNDTIRDLMGDTDAVVDYNTAKHHFYIRGVQSDGTSFSRQISMSDEDSIEQLLTNIGDSYGNTLDTKVVNVSMNDYGQIVVEDKLKGSSKLDFHMTAAVDYVNGGVAGLDAADINDAVLYGPTAGLVDNLDGGETNFDAIMREVAATQPAVVLANSLFVKEFVQSNSVASADSTISNIDGLLYDRTLFTKDGSKLSSSTPQIVRSDNSFALDTTKLSEVADITKGTTITTDDTLDGNQFKLTGTNIHGAAFDVQIDFNNTAGGGSTFTVAPPLASAGTYNIYDMGIPRAAVNADDMTYRQLMDTINMVVTDTLPQPAGTNTDPNTGLALTAAEEYDFAIKSSKSTGGTELSYDGKVTFSEIGTSNTKAEISLHDINSGDFTPGQATSVMTFNTNNALSVRDPKTDFFKELDLIISAVEDHKTYPDSSIGQIRNIGMQNALKKIDDIREHVSRTQAGVGANSNALTVSIERSSLMEISARTLRSEVIDTDIAEASLKLTQLSLNYQAMLSTVNKVSQLSLVNYM